MTLLLSNSAPGEARRSLEASYGASFERSLLDDVILLTSELVTNSVVHSGRPQGDPLIVTTTEKDGVLRVDVKDEGEGQTHVRPGSTDPPTGLGYVEIISDRWSSRTDGSFHVWFEFDVVSRITLHRAGLPSDDPG